MSEPNINNIPYAEWLEKNLQELFKLHVKSIYIGAVSEDGDVYRDYYNASMMDKLVISGAIQQDAMIDRMAADGIIEYVEEEDEENNE